MITENPAKALGLKDYGLAEGKKADLVVLDTKLKENAFIDFPERLYVLKDGRVTVQVETKVQVFR